MFDLVQERDVGGALSRTMTYLIIHGENTDDDSTLSERGRNQVTELARSRLIPAVRNLYTAPSDPCLQTAGILRKEFQVPVQVIDDLREVAIGKKKKDDDFYKRVREMWNDESLIPKNGESLLQAQIRIRDAIVSLAKKNPDDSIAIVTCPFLGILFNNLIVGGPLSVEDWLYLGHASCANYEYSKNGWSLVMPFDDSFLSTPSKISESIPKGIF